MIDLIAVLAVWRLSSLFVREIGPFEIFSRLRERIGVEYNELNQPVGKNELAKVFSCVWCMSVWIGWIIAGLIYQNWIALFYGLAYSGGAIVIDRTVNK